MSPKSNIETHVRTSIRKIVRRVIKSLIVWLAQSVFCGYGAGSVRQSLIAWNLFLIKQELDRGKAKMAAGILNRDEEGILALGIPRHCDSVEDARWIAGCIRAAIGPSDTDLSGIRESRRDRWVEAVVVYVLGPKVEAQL
jgi:hypothetical protein